METFFTGLDAREYRAKIKFIVSELLKQGLIKPRDPKKPKSAAYRFMVDRFYEYLKEEKYNGFAKKEEGK